MKRALALFLLCCLALGGCGKDPEPAGEPHNIAALTPTPAPQPVAAGANPVSVFYSSYNSVCRPLLSTFESRLGADPSMSASDTLIYLANHNLYVSEGLSTFGWLLSADTSDSYSSAVSGAADGSGAISPAGPEYEEEMYNTPAPSSPPQEDAATGEGADDLGDVGLPRLPALPIITPSAPMASPAPSLTPSPGGGAYALQFTYTSGRELAGILKPNQLAYFSRDGGTDTRLSLQDGVWTSTVSRDGVVTTLSCGESGTRFSVSGSNPDGSESVIHSWICDSSGAKYVEGQGLS